MSDDTATLTSATLYGGAALEALDHELQNVLQNICDPNTEPAKMRSATLVVKFKPNKERNIATIFFQASSNLAPAEALETSAFIGKDASGRAVANEINTQEPDQKLLPFCEAK
jgi:hypothetical protein